MILSFNIDIFSVGVAVTATAVLAAIIFLKNPRGATSRAFLYFSSVTILWDIANFLGHQSYPINVSFWLLRITIFIAVWLVFSLFHLLYVFPREEAIYPSWFFWVLVPVVIVMSLLNLTPIVFQKVSEVSPEGQITGIANGPGIAIFGIVVFGFITAAISLLLRKMIRAQGIEKDQSRSVLVGIFFTFVLILLGNFLLPAFFNEPRFLPLGPLFFLPLLFFTFYAIVKYRLLNIKVLSAEILVFVLAIVTLFEITLAQDIETLILRLVIFSLSLFFGILLIRSVLKEVEQRERLEQLTRELDAANAQLAQTNEKLEGMNEKLEKMDALKSEFVSMAGHQLRGPMTVIKGYISLILDGTIKGANAAVKDALKRAMFSTEQLIKLIASLLDLSRIEAGKIKYEMVEGDLARIISEVIDKFKEIGKKKGVVLAFENHLTDEQAKFIFDQDKIREAVVNLVDNAIKYSFEGGRIAVALDTTGSGGDARARISVRDGGIGIKHEDIGKLFDKFSRTEEAKNHDPNGLGIGLYFAKRVVQDHGGRTGVESEGIGRGSTFWLELPIKPQQAITVGKTDGKK